MKNTETTFKTLELHVLQSWLLHNTGIVIQKIRSQSFTFWKQLLRVNKGTIRLETKKQNIIPTWIFYPAVYFSPIRKLLETLYYFMFKR